MSIQSRCSSHCVCHWTPLVFHSQVFKRVSCFIYVASVAAFSLSYCSLFLSINSSVHTSRLSGMKEDLLPSAHWSRQSWKVTTRITANPLESPNSSSMSIVNYGRVGWRTSLLLTTLFLILGSVIATPLVVNGLRSDPVCVSQYIVEIRKS